MSLRRIAPVILLTAIILFCIASFLFFDAPLAFFFHQFRTSPWHGFWEVVTDAGESQWYLVPSFIVFLAFRKRNRQASISALFLFTTTAVSGLVADLLKFIFGRARPNMLLEQGIFGFSGLQTAHDWTSFPSGHSTTALCVAVTLSLLLPRFRAIFIPAGVIIALSRMVLDQHYLTDVVAGSMLGVATAFLFYQRYFHTALNEVRTL